MGKKREESKGDDSSGILGSNEIEDVRWLCSLSESELAMAIRRAKKIGHESLAKNFDLKVLRGLSYSMMEHLKEQLKDSLVKESFPECSKILDKCKLLQLDDVEESFSSMSSEELWPYICPDIKKKRNADMFDGTETPKKRQKFDNEDLHRTV